jgi:hypothetical protein
MLRLDPFAPALHIRAGVLALKTRFDRLGIDQTIRLSELGQATDADAAMAAKKPSDPDFQDRGHRLGDESGIIAQSLQREGLGTVGAIPRRLDLFVVRPFGILLGGQRG